MADEEYKDKLIAYIKAKRAELEELGEEVESCNGSQMDYEAGQCDGWQEVLDAVEEIINK